MELQRHQENSIETGNPFLDNEPLDLNQIINQVEIIPEIIKTKKNLVELNK
jgi:hypothetical protein